MTDMQTIQEVTTYTRKNPLIISPNLDALLDFDERTRRSADGLDSGAFSVGSVEVGLPPPPPREPRKLRSPGSVSRPPPRSHSFTGTVIVKTSDSVASAVPISNPYINPAPTLDIVFNVEKQIAQASHRIPELNSHPINSVAERRGESHPQKSPSSPDIRTSDPKQATPIQHHQTRQVPSDSRHRYSEQSAHLESPLLGHRVLTLPPNSDHLRRKGEPCRLKVPSSNTASEMLQVRRPDEQIGSSIISDGFNGGVSPGGLPLPMESHAERQMLLISHDRGTTSSTLSLSTGTNSTHDPPSTVDEPRISISSTIYTKSSHAQSLYSQHHNPQSFIPEPMSSRPYSEYRDARSRSHRSFIELSSQSDLAPAFPYSNRVGDFPQANLNTIGLTKSEQHPINTSVNAIPRPLSSSRKPPLPNTPKPIFNRLPGQLSSSKKHPPAPDLHILSNLYTVDRDMLPPTTNYLNPDERADLIKKSRKLTQVFGMTPGPESFTTQHDESHGGFIICSRGQRQRGPTYVSKDVQTSHIQSPAWPPAEGTRYLSANGRRHSTPLTPDEFSFLAQTTDGEISLQIGSNAEDRISYSVSSDHSNVHDSDGESPLAPSFIGLSNGEGLGDDMSSITSKKRRKRRAGLSSPSAPSFFENKTPEELAEAEKRRRRDKLARIHRFLGLRVPTDLVLGQCAPLASLPSTPRERTPLNALAEHEIDNHQDNIRHRRISSAVLTPSLWPDDLERLKEDLDGREKAINVRRAQKMGKVFGVQPPQTLYHTRQSPSLSNPIKDMSPTELSSSGYRNVNRSAYSRLRNRKTTRPGTSESNKQLLPDKDGDDPDHRLELRSRGDSDVYVHYRHSIDSLHDIIDRADRESLAELHNYLHNGDSLTTPTLQEFSRVAPLPASIKSERRRSLPAWTPSLLSLSSIHTIASITSHEATDFELRRRRAAKLTQFFGVDYRTMIKDVLESIEKGVEEEQKGGALNIVEAEDLLRKLRKLRTRRSKF